MERRASPPGHPKVGPYTSPEPTGEDARLSTINFGTTKARLSISKIHACNRPSKSGNIGA
jgi:hypothetical protein